MRILASALRAATTPRLDLMAPMTLHLRVWPGDLNIGRHMDNVRYLKLMDLARNEMLLRNGITGLAARRRIGVVVARCEVEYKRSLLPWERFTVHTQLLGWNARRFFIEQRFVRGDTLVTRGVFHCALSARNGVQAPDDFFAALVGGRLQSPPLPEGLTT